MTPHTSTDAKAPKSAIKQKIVIQDCSSGIYFGGLGTWTADIEKAIGFPDVQSAEEFARSQRLGNVRIVAGPT